MTWQQVRLKDLGDWYGGGTPSKSRPDFWIGGSIPWLSPKDMGPEVLHATEDAVTASAVTGSSVRLVPSNAVAVVVRSGILERKLPVAQVPFETTLNQDMKAVVPRPGIDPRWIAWALRAFERDLLLKTRKAGTTVASIEMPRFYDFELPLPPLEEQRRILDLLEDHLSRLDAAGTYIEANILRAARWHSGLVSRVLWDDEYQRAEVGDLLSEPLRNGRSDRAVTGSEAGTRTLTLTAVTKNAFTDANTKLTITTPDRASGLWLEPGDVFVQRSNTPELVGTTARYDGPREWAIFPDLLIRLRVDSRRIDSRFLTAALRSKEGHNQLRRKAKGLAGSMPKVDQAAIATAVIPVPGLAEQERALEQVEQATDALDKLRSELGRVRIRSAALRRSLLAAAFSGRLTGNTPDVSASEEMMNV